MNEVIEITRENYKNYKWDEYVKYVYRGLPIICDHEWDAGVYMLWLELPRQLYAVLEEKNIPYEHGFECGYMMTGGKPDFASHVEEILDYIDKYYEYFEPYI